MFSLFGTWMQSTAQGFLVFELTHSPAYLGYVSFASGIPTWLFMLYGGVVADRVPRRNMIIITQSLLMALAFLLALLTFLHLINAGLIILFAFFLGVVNAFDVPARQAFLLEMVEREDISNAVALNSTMFNGATAAGPAFAGIVYAALGPAWCFTINGISFIAVIGALASMKLKQQGDTIRRSASSFNDLREGVRYVADVPAIRGIVVLVAVVSLFGFSFVTLFPAWAVKVLGGDAKTNGLLQSARGIGALASALFVASLGRIGFKGKLLLVGAFVFPIVLFIFACMRSIPLSLVTLVVSGFFLILFYNMANSLIQSNVSDEYRGRVMSIYSLAFFGVVPIGGLATGILAQKAGEPLAVIAAAGVTLCAAAVIAWKVPAIRRLP